MRSIHSLDGKTSERAVRNTWAEVQSCGDAGSPVVEVNGSDFYHVSTDKQ